VVVVVVGGAVVDVDVDVLVRGVVGGLVLVRGAVVDDAPCGRPPELHAAATRTASSRGPKVPGRRVERPCRVRIGTDHR
jgi:hypothetical protein